VAKKKRGKWMKMKKTRRRRMIELFCFAGEVYI
jgi:hypothetical protein